MNILFLSSEAAPLFKTGGLGDVAGSLPIALKQLGHDIRLVLPKHAELKIDSSHWRHLQTIDVIYDHKSHPVKILQGYLPGSTVITYLLSEPHYLGLPYSDYSNHIDKFAFFSQAVATWLTLLDAWQPQLLHLNDWHVALVPVLLKHHPNPYSLVPSPYRFLLTIHNLSYQGVTPTSILKKLNLDPHLCQILKWDSRNHNIDILMEGIIHSDHINTVSPTYAREILTHQFGAKLEPILQSLSGKLTGILNGINTDHWNPATDTALTKNYNSKSYQSGKLANKLSLLSELGFPSPMTNDQMTNDIPPLVAFIGRIDRGQKGVDLILQALHKGHLASAVPNSKLETGNSQLVLLGTGDKAMEKTLHQYSQKNSQFKAILKFDNALARKIYAAADFVLIPSKFEPCGLVQMIAMRYGTIPIVRDTGGLADTVVESQTGFLFPDYTSHSMMDAVNRAIKLCSDPTAKKQLVQNCFSQDFSWPRAASEYANLYEKLIAKN